MCVGGEPKNIYSFLYKWPEISVSGAWNELIIIEELNTERFVTMIITRGVDILTCSGNTLITEPPAVNATAVQRGRHRSVHNAVGFYAAFD